MLPVVYVADAEHFQSTTRYFSLIETIELFPDHGIAGVDEILL
jgi:hypothetical protein